MKTLWEYLLEAEEKRVAIGHFNISDSEGFGAVVQAAKSLEVPVIIGVSEGEREFIGLEEVIALGQVARNNGRPVFINADHTYSLEKVKLAIDKGVDSVIIDAADKTLKENIAITKEVVEYAQGRALVEGELGFIGKSSKVFERVPEGVVKTNPEDAKIFVEETGVNLLAPSVGNIHGIIRTGEPKLDIELIGAIHNAVSIPLVLHGASGNSDADIRAAIAAGIRIVHINTELRLAYKEGIEEGLKSGEVAPYKFLAEGVEGMKKVVTEKLKLFNAIN